MRQELLDKMEALDREARIVQQVQGNRVWYCH